MIVQVRISIIKALNFYMYTQVTFYWVSNMILQSFGQFFNKGLTIIQLIQGDTSDVGFILLNITIPLPFL